ncbi:MAG TPA: hypothetical protein VEY05_08610 [Beijerinckiaceae bacterium]|nr:hypothetical protein [Beijerinckiaceae bacterium]
MRKVVAVAAVALLVSSAAAQQGRPPGPQGKPPPQPAAPAPPPIFPCRTAEEICFLGVVTGKNEIAVVFTNAEKADGIEAKPIPVTAAAAPGAVAALPLDLAPHLGRIVMLTGTYDPQAGLTKAELVEVASPLASLVVKAQLGAEEPPPPAGKPQPQQRPQGPPKR